MMTKCRECKKDVSTEATTCPHCGCPQKQEKTGIPKCPTCGSTEVTKISTGAKLTTMFIFGPLTNLTCTFKCNKCGHKW